MRSGTLGTLSQKKNGDYIKLSDLRALIDAEPESVEPVWIVSRDNKGRTTNIIPGHPTKFDIGKLPDGTPLFASPPADNLIAEKQATIDRLTEQRDRLFKFIKDFDADSYIQPVYSADFCATTCEIKERATQLIAEIEAGK